MAATETNVSDSTTKDVVKPASDVIARQLGDAAVLIRMRTSRIYELNSTGARIWDLVKEHARLDTVIDAVVDEFHVSRLEAEKAVTELVAVLRSEGLL